MKKYLILCVLVCCTLNSTFAQKKGVKTATAKSTPFFAKIDNLIAEVKSGNFQVTIVDKGKEVGALIVQQADKNFSPIGTKLASFKAAGTTLYLLTWTEKRINKTDLKTEEITLVYNVVYAIYNVAFPTVLPHLTRDELKAMCRALRMSDEGTEKAGIVARLIGEDAEALSVVSEAAEEREPEPEPSLVPWRTQVIDLMKRDELIEVIDELALEVPDRRVVRSLREAVAGSDASLTVGLESRARV